MIELRGLHLGNIARSPAESVRPDLWPDHAWVPALGCTGGVLYDLCGGKHGALNLRVLEWIPGVGLRVGENNSAGIIDIGNVPAVGGYTFSAHGTATWSYQGGICSLLGRDGTSTWSGHADRLVLLYGRFAADAQVYGPLNATYATGSASVLTWAGATRAGGGGDIILADGVEVPGAGITGKVYGDVPLRLMGGLYSSGYKISNVGSTLSSFIFYGSFRPEVLATLHADPLLPFRRRQPVFYSVPSGGGSTRSLIAAMTGESVTGTISAIIARALTGDVTATSITGAITASMARDLLASLQGQSTTGDIAATLQRLLLASFGSSSLTGDVATTTARSLLADLQASSTTPDIAATLAALVALTANISGTTTTPAVAATMARTLAANLAGQSATGAITVEFAGMLLLVASIAGTSTTGALTATTGRELRAAIEAASSTGTVDGQLLRQIAATIAGASLTGAIAAELVSLVSLAASVVGVSLSPAIVATLSRDLAAEVAAGSTTGAASATVARTLAAAVDTGSLTPDNLVLILTGLGILHDTTIISRTPRRGITSRTVRRTIHSA